MLAKSELYDELLQKEHHTAAGGAAAAVSPGLALAMKVILGNLMWISSMLETQLK